MTAGYGLETGANEQRGSKSKIALLCCGVITNGVDSGSCFVHSLRDSP
jgi:hypothetical protein